MPRKGKGSKPLCRLHQATRLWARHWWARLTLTETYLIKVRSIEGYCDGCDTGMKAHYGSDGDARNYVPVDDKTHEMSEQARRRIGDYERVLRTRRGTTRRRTA